MFIETRSARRTLESLLLVLTLAYAAPVTAQVPTGTEEPTAAQEPFTVEVTGAGPAVILIPGLASSGEVWDGVVDRYDHGYELHVLTLAGFAGVPALDREPFLRTQRDAIIAYIRAERLDSPVLVGHSLGGFLAFWVSATAPELAGPVLALDGVPFLPALNDTTATEATLAAQAEQAAAFYATMSPQQMEAQTKMAADAMVSDTAAARRITAWGAESDPTTAGRAYAEMMTTDLRDDVSAIESPVTLIMAGSGRDPGALERVRQAYAHQVRAIPHAEVIVADDARHFVMYDDPDLVYEALDRLLGEGR